MDSSAKIFLRSFVATLLFVVVLYANPGFSYSLEQQSIHFASVTPSTVLTSLPIIATAPIGTGTGTGTGATAGMSTGAGTSPSSIPPVNNSNPNATTFIPPVSITPSTGMIGAGITPNPANYAAPGTCAVSRLTPQEAKNILNLTHDGFNAKQIGDGSDINQKGPVKDLGKTEIIGKDLGGKEAVKVEAPSIAAPASKFSFLKGVRFSGPFGIGLILDTTLRVGKCDYPVTERALCKISQAGLAVDTSGVGFKSGVVNAFESVKGVVNGTTGKSLAEETLSPSDYNKLHSNYLGTDTKDFTVGTFGRGELIKNSIMVNQYTAKNSTTCNNSACTINTYSAFDKYFNTWMTTGMVVSNVGPMALNKAFKLLSKGGKILGDGSLATALGLHLPQKLNFLASPGSLLGKARINHYNALIKEAGLDKYFEKLTINDALFSSGARGEISKLVAKESEIWKMPPEQRKKFFQAVEDLKSYTVANAEAMRATKTAYDAEISAAEAMPVGPLRDAQIRNVKVTNAQKAAETFNDWDDTVFLDSPAWLKNNDELLGLGGYAVRRNGPYPTGQGYVDLSTSGSYNFKGALVNFSKEGSWSSWAASTESKTFNALNTGELKLYKIVPDGGLVQANVALPDLKYHVAKMGSGTYSVKMPTGEYMPLTPESVAYIESNPLLHGNVSIYRSSYVDAGTLTPEDFANRVMNERILKRSDTAVRNMDDLHNALVQNDYVPRTYWSALDKQFATEGDMIKRYYTSVSGAARGTVAPIVYWNLKQGLGNWTGNEQYSAFLLPDTWSTIVASQGQGKIYRDSFIDFYANTGSDTGDMFKRAFTSVPAFWNKIIEMAVSTSTQAKDLLSKGTGGFFSGSYTRDTVGDLAFYMKNDNCSGCSGTFDYKTSANGNNYFILGGFNVGTNMQAMMVEAKTPEEKAKEGSLIVSYTHHSDLSGKTGQVEGEKFDISGAREKGDTCDQKLRKVGLGFVLGSSFDWANLGFAGSGAGGILLAGESIGYAMGLGPGLMASALQQIMVGQELQDCTDDVEGYYVHFFAPPSKDAAKAKSKEVISSETITNAMSDLGTRLEDVARGSADKTTTPQTPQTPVQQSLDKLNQQFTDLANKATQANILQAALEMLPPSNGSLEGKDVFYVWYKEQASANSYRTTGKIALTDSNGNKVETNFEDGTIKANGKIIVGPENADHARMSNMDNRRPAQVVPVTLNRIGAPMTSAAVFELNSYGEIRVLDQSVLNCIQQAIKDQTGITYSGNELTQAFGPLKAIGTQNYSSVFARDGMIYLEGPGGRLQGSSSSRFVINGYWDTNLLDATTSANGGQFIGMNFEHGEIVLKP
ncbi:MAG: hypothetical protein NTY48_02530, partial [Candidatus Diapherotrites archaeon]|nr:hypothetical protein [Candidatus Diapherotrites archaeon]